MAGLQHEQEQEMYAQIKAHLPDIDHVQLLRCYDGKWRLALMQGDDIVDSSLQADVGDAEGLELIMGMAARLISAAHDARERESDGT